MSGRELASERQPVVRVPASLMRFVRTVQPMTVTELAEKHRYVAEGVHVGQWRRSFSPHTVKIMDTYGKPWVREVWFCGVDQSGKTNTMLNCLIWAIVYQHGHIFMQMAREEDVRKVVRGKIIPMLQKSPFMARYLSDRADDTGLAAITLKNGKSIIPAHAASPASTATWSAACTFSDETDKYPPVSAGEASAIENIRKRSRTFRGRDKHFFASTPAGAFVYRNTLECQQVFEGRLRCPHCQSMIRMDAEHLVLPDKANHATVALSGCGYACNECGADISEQERQESLRLGPWWACIKGADLRKPETVGFLHRAWDCHDLSLTQIAVAFLKGRDGNLSDKRNWAHGFEAIDYEADIVDRSEDYILRLVDPDLQRREVPLETQCLLLLVDTQKLGFRYQIWAVGWGENPAVAVIDRSFVKDFKSLRDLAQRDYLAVDGSRHQIRAAWIDSGGGTDPYHPRHSRTTQVYAFCKINRVFNPLKGKRGDSTSEKWTVSRLEYMPTPSGKRVAIKNGLNLWHINTTRCKNDLAHALSIEPGDPGSIRLYKGIASDYAAQMCAEYQDERGFWICPRNKDNHDWDISVYGIAAIDIMDLRKEKPVEQSFVQPGSVGQQNQQSQQTRRRW